MARHFVLVDDLDGSEGAETITYTVNGQEYEVDLSEDNAEKFHDALGPTFKTAAKLGDRLKLHDAGTAGAETVAEEAVGTTSHRSVHGLRARAWT